MPRPTVAVFGAGIAGLTAAHELVRRGHRVSVFESSPEAGGFYRSARRPGDGNTPSEYSWHGIGPWYHNLFDLLKQIPFDETGSLYERALSRPIDFGLAPDRGRAAFDDTPLVNVRNMFRMSWLDVVLGSYLMLKSWGSNLRTRERYAERNAAEAWKPLLSDEAWRTWRSSFGPWIGSDWTNVSLHTAGQFFQKQLLSEPSHVHRADADGPGWVHGARSGWLLLRGPSSEWWFDRWVTHLERSGVDFTFEAPLERFEFDGRHITGAQLESGAAVERDRYVLATNPFAAREILERTPSLALMDQLRLFGPLVERGPHAQVSLRLAFGERVRWPRERAALIVADSEFNLTLFGQEQAWDGDVELGDGVRSLWTVTACVATEPGAVFGRPLTRLTKAEFVEEVLTQLSRCEALDALLREANDGRGFAAFPIVKVEVWHEWLFSRDGLRSRQPKWVNTTRTQPYMPTQATPVPNLALAGAHTRTEVDVWSIEAAVESGRRAARVFEPDVEVLPQHKPGWLRALARADDVCYSAGAPHVIDVLLAGGVCALVAAAVAFPGRERQR